MGTYDDMKGEWRPAPQTKPLSPKSPRKGGERGEIKFPRPKNYSVEKSKDNWDKTHPYLIGVFAKIAGKDGISLSDGPTDDFDFFEFNVNPTSITVSTPFAINTTPTTRGILEEHNSVVFENLVIAGTTGITPQHTKKTAFQGTRKSGPSGTIMSLKDTVSSQLSNLGINTAQTFADSTDDSKAWEFGHAQLHQLGAYLRAYAEYKKTHPEARLVFISQKDRIAWIVTPVSFEFNKAADNPFAFNYRIIFRGWDRASYDRDITTLSGLGEYLVSGTNTNLIATIYGKVREARAIFSAVKDGLKSVVSDVANFYSLISEIMLAIKDLAGIGRTLADTPELVKDKWEAIAKDFSVKVEGIEDEVTGGKSSQRRKNLTASATKLSNTVASKIESSDPTNPSGIPLSDTSPGLEQTKLDMNNPFNTFDGTFEHLDLLDEYTLDNLELSDLEEDLVDSKTAAVRALSIGDYDNMRQSIEEIRDAYANLKSLGDEDFNRTLNRISPSNTETPTSSDYKVIEAFNDMIAAIDALSATNDLIRQQIPDPFIRSQKIVEDSDIVIQKSNVAFPTPFPFGGTLEGLASLYLNDPNRWIEIALINELKPPYVDEDGFTKMFTSSGNGNSFTVGDNTNLVLGQEIFISSVTKRAEKRYIVRIDELAEDSFLITVDGDDDLSEFTATHLAQMKTFTPNTINSNKVIYIPLGREVAEANESIPNVREIPITADLDYRQKLMGVDIALTDDFDLAVDSNGDFKLTAGFNNAVQAIKLKMAIERGSLKSHPGFGVGLAIGEKTTLTAQLIKEMLEEAILADKRFASIPEVSIEIDGSTIKVKASVRPSDNGNDIPIQFKI